MPKEIAQAVPCVRVVVSGREKVDVSPVSVGKEEEAAAKKRPAGLPLMLPLLLLREPKGRRGKEKRCTYMYVMLLRRLGCSISGYHLNIHITLAQLKLANTGQERCLTIASCCSFNPKMPLPPWPPYAPPTRVLSPGGCTASFAIPSTTLAKTYMTICWLTLLEAALPCPNTQYPPKRPARNGCTLCSLPLTFRNASMDDL